ncbi:MAG: toll/interleukin-1 receptor domain-containing protein [Chloroflexota bacterium]
MTEAKRPLKVFLCHAHADHDAVRGLYSRLTKDGVDAWLDQEKLLPGQDWELEIRKAVREAGVVVVCLSKQFNQAGFQQKEVRSTCCR